MCDLVIEGKPIEKLIEVVSKAIGVVYEPRQMVRMAKAEAEAERIKAIEHAKTEALIAGDEAKVNELSLIEKRIVAKEEKRKKNIEKVIGVATQTIKDEAYVSTEPVNLDWATRFFDIVQDISDEQMQDLWGRILAGEVKRPHSYSLRTLEVLRNITSEEAQLFERIAQYVMFDRNHFIYYDSSLKDYNIEMTYEDIAKLIEIGFLQAGSSVQANLHNNQGEVVKNAIAYGNYIVLIDQPPVHPIVSFSVFPLTKTGSELFRLLTITSNENYLKCFANSLKKRYGKLVIQYADLKYVDYEKNEYVYDEETIKNL
ncbi:MAG: DUF2806 domain-containing protein [Paludibacteraceae bacterium]|nr:DUF2806 domain-containing protein [Paludibacteraceae bacterium]